MIFVIHRLPFNLVTKDIIQDLQELSIKAVKWGSYEELNHCILRSTAKPLYIIMKGNVNIKTLNQKIKYLYKNKVGKIY